MYARLGIVLTVLGTAAVGLAREPQTERVEGKQRLSHALPERLAAFVTKTGADRELTEVEVEAVAAPQNGEADINRLAGLLQATELVNFGGIRTVIGRADGKNGSAKSTEPVIIAVTQVDLEDGTVLEPGDLVFVGDAIVRGGVLNAGDTEFLLSGDAGDDVVIGPGAIAFALCEKSCSTTCKPGFFACCNSNSTGTCVTCLCFPDGSSTFCESGGPGATGCSASAAK